ncbi:MAG: hypothetical protein ACKOWN_03550 [Microbacteriaceae bacterium]
MISLIHRILAISWMAPVRRLAYTVAVNRYRYLSLGIPQREILRASRAKVKFGQSADSFVNNMDREALVAAARHIGSRRVIWFVYRLLVRRKNYITAGELIHTLPFEAYSFGKQLSIIGHGYHGVTGLESDRQLDRILSNSELSIKTISRRQFRALVRNIRNSGFSYERKMEAIAKLSVSDDDAHKAEKQALAAASVQISMKAGQSVAVPDSLRKTLKAENPTDRQIETLRSYWAIAKERVDRDTLTAFLQRALHSQHATVRQLPFICRELQDDEILAAISRDELFTRLADFPHIFNFRTATPQGELTATLTARAVEYWFDTKNRRGKSKFDSVSVDIQNEIVGILNRADRWDLVLDRIDFSKYSNTLLEITFARAFLDLMADEYSTSVIGFESILRENPGNQMASLGLQWASVRATGSLNAVESLRAEVGRGSFQAGRPGIDETKSDGIIMTSRQWRGIHVRIPLANLKHAWAEVQEFFGDRWFDFSRFPTPDKSRNLLVFPVHGVSDEVREAYHYQELVNQFKHVTIVCDPRLTEVLRTSVPDATFVPFSRRDKPSHLADKREGPIQEVPAILSNYLPDSLRELVLDPNTIMTPSQNFVGRRLALKEYDLTEGAYLSNGRKPVARKQKTKKRVGILWRSHVTTGFRGMMYLAFDDVRHVLENDEIEFVSLQHKLTDEEAAFIADHNIEIPDVDLFNDFNGISDLVSTLDLVVGLSTFPIEFAAALGCPVWMLGHSPENFYLRTLGGQRRGDILTANSTIIAPDVPQFWQPRQTCIDETMRVLDRELTAFARR